MYSYIVRRLVFGGLTVLGVSIVVFAVLRILPGDPLVAIFGAEGFTKLSEAERARYMADLGLSDPLVVQYFHWLGDIVRGDFGRSFFRAESVADMLLRRGPLTAEIALIARSSLLEVVRGDYVRTARAKGLPGRLVISLHALPNALLPVITLSGILIGFVLAGSIPIERAFATPGLGFAMYIAVYERDVFVMQNLVFLYSIIFVMLNILIDVTIAWLDPRIRYR